MFHVKHGGGNNMMLDKNQIPETVNNQKQYEWIDFYTELATKLLAFKNDRKALIQNIISIYQEAEIHLPTLEKDNHIVDIDPFTVFGMFNKGITQANRQKLLLGFAKQFSVSAKVPKQFAGIPVLNNQQSVFYGFGTDRKSDDIDNLWNLFAQAIALAKSDTEENRRLFIEWYDKTQAQYLIKWNITMGLFWIRPYTYINLDSVNRSYIKDKRHMPFAFTEFAKRALKKVPNGELYLKIKDLCQEALSEGKYAYTTFPELSEYAWMEAHKKSTEPEPSQVSDEEQRTVHYWLYSPGAGADKWDECYERGIMLLGWGELGNLEPFENKESMRERMKSVYGGSSSYKNCAHATWQFVHDMNPGDVVFVKQGFHNIIGKGIISSDYRYEERKDGFSNVRSVKWTDKGNWEIQSQTPVKTLTDVTEYTDFLQELQNALAEKTPNAAEEPDEYNSLYTKGDFLQDVYMTESEYNQLTSLLHRKKNVILQGAPGVGKTFIAKKLAYAMMGQKDEERVKLVQFHQSYSYEDFIMGYRPTETGFALHKGVFYEFCKKAEKDKDRDYFFIIDEINRGNLSKIFGELFMLLENDKRGEELQLLYSEKAFSIPKNLYVIGMMNTADRSLAMLDYALRRRFAFFTIQPGFGTDGFRTYQTSLGQATFDRLIERIKALNEEIKEDASLGEGFRIGHSYFCNLTKETCSDGELQAIVEYEIIPLLKEYWFDEPSKVETWMQNLRSVLP